MSVKLKHLPDVLLVRVKFASSSPEFLTVTILGRVPSSATAPPLLTLRWSKAGTSSDFSAIVSVAQVPWVFKDTSSFFRVSIQSALKWTHNVNNSNATVMVLNSTRTLCFSDPISQTHPEGFRIPYVRWNYEIEMRSRRERCSFASSTRGTN